MSSPSEPISVEPDGAPATLSSAEPVSSGVMPTNEPVTSPTEAVTEAGAVV